MNLLSQTLLIMLDLEFSFFIFTLFFTILIGKGLSRAVTWTGVGSIDKTFGLLFGIFKGYVVSVCIFFNFKLVLSCTKIGGIG